VKFAAIVSCACGRPVEFTVLPSGVTVEWCVCGFRRPIRGRTALDIEAEEAVFRARVSETPSHTATKCAWPSGCEGYTASRKTDLCPLHCDERRRQKNRDKMRAQMRERRALVGVSA
jgi:hypothetical protein